MSTIRIITVPNFKKNIITKISDDEYEVHLKAKPERNQANQLLILALAEYFNIPTSNIKITSGHHSAHKRIEINRL
jgi:uncharacterized protein YggU (UPF0235/DUF167 family)